MRFSAFFNLLEVVDLLVEVSDHALPVLCAFSKAIGRAHAGLTRATVQLVAVEAEEGSDGGNASLRVHGRALSGLSTKVCCCKHLFSL